MTTNVVVCGGIAVGKTTLTRRIIERLPEAGLVEEVPGENPFLADFYREPHRWSFHSRIGMLSLFLQNYTKRDANADLLIFDRSVHELVVFADLHRDRGFLTEKEYAVYGQLHQSLLKMLEPPSLLIYLHCPSEVALQRSVSRGRLFERGIEKSYIEAVASAYDHWLRQYPDNERVVRVDTSREIDLDLIVHRVLAAR